MKSKQPSRPSDQHPVVHVAVQPQVTPYLKYSGVKHVESSNEVEAKYMVRTSKDLIDMVAALEKPVKDGRLEIWTDKVTGKKLARYRVVTVYYDTKNLLLRKEGYVVRFRFKNAKHGYDNHFSIKYRDSRVDDGVPDQIMCRPEVDISLTEDEPAIDLVGLSQIPDMKLRKQLLQITKRQQLMPFFLTDVTRSKFDIATTVEVGGRTYVAHMEFAADECFYYSLRNNQHLFPLYPDHKFESPERSAQIIVGDIKYGKVNGQFLNYEPQFEIEIKGATHGGRNVDLSADPLKYAIAREATLRIIAYIEKICPGITITENFQSKADSGFRYLATAKDC